MQLFSCTVILVLSRSVCPAADFVVRKVADINPSGDAFKHAPDFTEFNSELYFAAQGPDGEELYKTNGSSVAQVTDFLDPQKVFSSFTVFRSGSCGIANLPGTKPCSSLNLDRFRSLLALTTVSTETFLARFGCCQQAILGLMNKLLHTFVDKFVPRGRGKS